MPWKITKLPIYYSTKKKAGRSARDLIRKAAMKRSKKEAAQRANQMENEINMRRNLVLRIAAMREQKFKWAEIDKMLGRKRCDRFYSRNKFVLELKPEDSVREFRCAQCNRHVVIKGFDRRTKFCSKICEKRYWRHRKAN